MPKNNPAPPPVEGNMAYWLMLPCGIIMPAALPPEVADKMPEGTVQVRARVREHLDAFRKWCPELGPTVDTPSLDYDVRAYCLKEDLARAVARITLEIDAPKFKPTTHGCYGLPAKLAGELHGTYNAIWGAVISRLSPVKAKSWGSHTKVSQPDPEASSEVCQRDGHLFPAGSKGGQVKVVHCQDCDARRSTSPPHVITYPRNHRPWREKVSA